MLKIKEYRIWLMSLGVLAAVGDAMTVGFETVDKPGLFNFVVAIKSKAGVCTGAIVSKDWVLTAAHCLYSDGTRVSPGDVTVMAGITDYEYPQEASGQLRTAMELKVHPKFWDRKIAKFDLALIRVNASFTLNEWVGNISVAGDGWPVNRDSSAECMSVGFGGYLGDKSPVKQLKVWNVTAVYGPSGCPCTRPFQYKRLVCVKNKDYAKLCKGDDGGPLVCGNVVRGVAHMIRNWYRCSEDPRYPLENCVGSPERGMSIYMFLCPFNDWLHGVVSDIPHTPATCGASCSAPVILILILVLGVTLQLRAKMFTLP